MVAPYWYNNGSRIVITKENEIKTKFVDFEGGIINRFETKQRGIRNPSTQTRSNQLNELPIKDKHSLATNWLIMRRTCRTIEKWSWYDHRIYSKGNCRNHQTLQIGISIVEISIVLTAIKLKLVLLNLYFVHPVLRPPIEEKF